MPAHTATSPHKPNSFARGKLVRLVSMITIAALSSASADEVVKPGDNLSAAIKKVQPGGALVLEPGVYYQRITLEDVAGTAESPITIKARKPGSVTINGAKAGTGTEKPLAWTHVEGDLYSTTLALPLETVTWMMVDGRMQFAYVGLENLKFFRAGSADPLAAVKIGPREGFCNVPDKDKGTNTVYVRLMNGKNPNNCNIQVSFVGASPNITIGENCQWIVIEGLKLSMAGRTSAISAKPKSNNIKNITVRDCFIEGAQNIIDFFAVKEGAVVEFNEFSQYPVYEWRAYWKQVYGVADGVRLCGPDAKFNHNLAYDTFDHLQLGARNPASESKAWSEATGNLWIRNTDDAIEFDTKEALGWRVHHNIIIDPWVVFALSPVWVGELVIDHNIAVITPEQGRWDSTLLKLVSPWVKEGKPETLTTRNSTIVHNTFVNRVGERTPKVSDALYWTKPNLRYEGMVYENNLASVTRPNGCVSFKAWDIKSQGFTLDPGKYNLYAGDKEFEESVRRDMQFAEDPGFVDRKAGNVNLAPSSPALNAGKKDDAYYQADVKDGKPDIGAIEAGQPWEFKRPGPRWADEEHAKAVRPPLGDFSPALAGFPEGWVYNPYRGRPGIPGNLTAASAPGNKITLTWSGVEGATNQQLSWGTNEEADNGGTVMIDAKATTHTFDQLEPGKYSFKLRSVNDSGASDFTAAVAGATNSVARPAFSVEGGTFDGTSTQVAISCSEPASTIRYTLDGSEPTERSPIIASGSAVTVNFPSVLSARAWKTGLDVSATTKASYHGKIGAKATGGSVSRITGSDGKPYQVHVFKENGVFVPKQPLDVEYLVVAGGGGGGASNLIEGVERSAAGGGGAGGLLKGTMNLSAGDCAITVGTGGARGDGWKIPEAQGNDGGNSSFGSAVTAIGGGGGGAELNPGAKFTSGLVGKAGGSGGGAAFAGNAGTAVVGGEGTPGQGNKGGEHLAQNGDRVAGGGGGAGGPGGNANIFSGAGKSGPGLESDITGIAKVYAAGGNGFFSMRLTNLDAFTKISDVTRGVGLEDYTPSKPSQPNTGDGGDGNHDGGSGIVVIRYPL